MPKRSKAELDSPDYSRGSPVRNADSRPKGDCQTPQHQRAKHPLMGKIEALGRSSPNPQLRGRAEL